MSLTPSALPERYTKRDAIAYMRQSTPAQLRDHSGSTALQRDLPEILQSLGWAPENIEVVDEDLGVSAATPGQRPGFNRVIELMKTGSKGIVAVTAISRLIRNLQELVIFAVVARQYDVLLWHSGQIVDFRDPTQEFLGLLLGLDAVREHRTFTELARRARWEKAKQGLAPTRPPVGYVTISPGVWGKDQNPRVRETIQLVFDKFLEFGSSAAVARWFNRSGLKLPGRRSRAHQPWTKATHSGVLGFLKNPVYAGVYIFGRTAVDEPTQPRARRPLSECIRVEGHHEPYVALHLWADIQQRIAQNRNPMRPPLGRGKALCQGLLCCVEHNQVLQTFYPNREYRDDGTVRRTPIYRCAARSGQEPWKVFQIAALLVDRAVESEVLKALVPPSLREVEEAVRDALSAYEATVRAREDEIRHADQEVAEAERAFRQVLESHPRLKARWADRIEEALRKQEQRREFHALHPLSPPLVLDQHELEELQRLVQDLPRLWRHASPEQRKAVVRTVLKRIEVTPRPGRWTVQLCWVGGATTCLDVLTQRGLQAAVQTYYEKGLTPSEIARRLQQDGIVRAVGPAAGTPHDERSITRMLSRRLLLPRSAELPAYPYIRERFMDGATARQIATELNAGEFRHLLGTWTANRVEHAVVAMRQKRLPGIEPLPSIPPLKDAIRTLHEAGLEPETIAARLRAQNIRSRRRCLPTPRTVRAVLSRSGLRTHGDTPPVAQRGLRSGDSTDLKGATDPPDTAGDAHTQFSTGAMAGRARRGQGAQGESPYKPMKGAEE